jgi:hypothetical protein
MLRLPLALVFGLFAASLSSAATAQPVKPPGRVELRLQPLVSTAFGLSFTPGGNGLGVTLPERGDAVTSFGLNAGFGYLVTPHVEPGASLDLNVVSASGTLTQVGMSLFVKFNLWAHRFVNPIFEPYAGFVIFSLSNGTSQSLSFFRGGLSLGAEFLVGSWGIRLWTGFEAVAGESTHAFTIPLRWAFVVYF